MVRRLALFEGSLLGLLVYGLREGVDDAAQRRGAQLERDLIDDQAGADVHDALDLRQVVGLEHPH